MALSRFSELDESDLKTLLKERDSESTKKNVKASVAVFLYYLEAKGQQIDAIECVQVLRKFCAEVRLEDGKHYAKKSMVTIRYGLQKHFLRTRNQDIINDKLFAKSNEMFKAVLVQLKKEGVGESVPKKPITPENMQILYRTAFNTHTAGGLQRKVMFEYLYYFCNRGRENLRELKKGDFTVGIDSSGREYVVVTSKQTKNHRGDNMHDIDNKQGQMYDKPGEPSCPVASFKKYANKLHQDNSNFWQRPKKQVNEDDSIWYDNSPVGKNALYTFMQKLSQDYHLSKRYSNHCVRATSITTLDHKGVEAQHIMGVSGHTNENSIKCYSSKLSDDQKRQMSDILSENIALPSKSVKMCATSTASRAAIIGLSQPAPLPPAPSLPHIPDFLEDDEIDILLSLINEQKCTLTGTGLGEHQSRGASSTFNFSNCQVTFNVTKHKLLKTQQISWSDLQ